MERKIKFENIPEQLKVLNNWVMHDNKIPKQITGENARSDKEQDWSNFNTVKKLLEQQYKEYGISISLGGILIGIDLDNCYYDENGRLKEWAYNIIKNLRGAYIEKSLNGRGLHIILLKKRNLLHRTKKQINFKIAKYKETNKTNMDIDSKDGIEIYYTNRFLTMTGDVVHKPEAITDESFTYVENLFKSLIDIQEDNNPLKNKKSSNGWGNEDFKNIKSKVGIFDVIKLYGLDKTLEGDFCGCPFHDENIKSLFLYSLTNSFYCFGCNVGGDIFSFVQMKEGIDKKKALKFLSEKFNIPFLKNSEEKGIIIKDNCYFSNVKKLEKLSNFIIELNHYIELEEFSVDVTIKTGSNTFEHKLLKRSDFENKSNFKKAIHKVTNLQGSFYGGDSDVEKIKDLILNKKVETIKGLKYSGIFQDNEKYFYISHDSNIVNNSDMNNKYTVVNNRNNIFSKLHEFDNSLTLSDYTKAIKNILNINNKITMITTLSYMAGCFFRSRLFESKIKYPHFSLSAESSTGKSTIKDCIVLPFFSVLTGESTASTRFPLNCALASSNTIPLVIDEFKFSKMKDSERRLWSELTRMSFDNLTYSRGRIDQSSDTFTYRTSIMMFGENSFIDLADINRCISVYTDRYNNLTDLNMTINELLSQESIISSLGHLILKQSLKYSVKELKELFIDNRKKIKLNPRNIDNVACVLLGLQLIEDTFKQLDFDIFSLIGGKDLLISGIEAMQFEINQSGSNFSYSVIPKMLSEFDTMVSLGLLSGQDISLKSGNIALNLKNIFPKYTQYRKNYGISSEYIEESQFTIQLRKSQYFKKYENAGFSRPSLIENKIQKKAYILNTEKVIENDLCPNIKDMLNIS